MTNRERLIAIMSGKPPDRIPWIPRLLLWYNAHKKAGTLPERYRGWTLREIERDLNLGTPARDGRVFATRTKNVEVKQTRLNDLETRYEYITPVGTVTTLWRGSEVLRQKAIQDLQVEFMLKRREDYAVVEYIIENTDYVPTYEEYLAYDADIGDDGVPIVPCGDCPFHHWQRALVGYNDAYYHLNDYSNEVERLLKLIEQRDREIVWQLIADSPAPLILHGVHFDSYMTPPPVFDQFITPYYRLFSRILNERGKTLCMHADADSRLILQHIKDAGFNMVETFTTAPMVSCTLKEARAAWGNDVIIWGAVPSVILEDTYAEEQFEDYMRNVFDTVAPGDAFILGVADNVMPAAKIERIARISEMVEEFGNYPVQRRGGDSVPALRDVK